MAVPQASSRLELLQARFQQKQLQEKEQKLLQLYDQQQQRAYQVVQRGSAGSNGSSHGSTISQHTVTKTSTSSHTTSTSQGGKVRQMFDERRQTTVKGIDRSYPLEPLENKPRKQTNGNAVQRNGNVTVSRQSVTVKRVARADANSNLNGGKPVVSYHEEITRESFGPSERQSADDDEFGNENHVTRYANGNHRDQTHIEEVLDEDTTQRNRMMAKLHLMEYDETLKHRVKNDLESEEFPEDFMVDVPDKLPKQSVTKKLSQAEARLERFKNANARRNNSVAKNTSTISLSKKRSDPVFPTKPTSSGNEMMKNKTQKIVEKGSLGRRESPRSAGPEVTSVAYKNVEETLSSSDPEGSRRRKSDGPRFFCRESEKSATTYAIDSKNAGRFSPDSSKRVKRSESPKYLCKESEKSATTYAIDSKTAERLSPGFSKNVKKRSESPKYFCKETEKSATTYTIDSKTADRLSPEFPKNVTKRNESPKFLCKESEKSATTYTNDLKTARKLFPEFSKDMKHSVKIESKRNRNVSAVDNQNVKNKLDRSAMTMGIDTVDRGIKSPESGRTSRTPTPEIVKKIERKAESNPIKNKSPNFFERLRERSLSPQFFNRKSKKSTVSNIKDSKSTSKSPEPRTPHLMVSPEKQEHSTVHIAKPKSADFRKNVLRSTNTSPQLFSTDPDRSSTIILVKPETIIKPKAESIKSRKKQRTPEPTVSKPDVASTNRITELNRKTSEEDVNANSKYNIRNSVSRFFSEQCERAARNVNVELAEIDKSSDLSRGSSPVSLKDMDASSPTSRSSINCKNTGKSTTMTDVSKSSHESLPKSREMMNRKEGTSEFFCYETDKSATTVSLKPESTKQLTDERSKSSRSKGSNSINESLKNTENFSPVKNTKITINIGKGSNRDSSPRSQKILDSRSGTPEFFCYETDRSATTVSLKPKAAKNSTIERSKSPRPRLNSPENIQTRSSEIPDNFGPLKGNKTTVNINKSSSRDSSPKLGKIVDSRSGTPEFFCYETDRSATTVSLKPKAAKNSTIERSKSPRPRLNSPENIQTRSSEVPDNFDPLKGNKTTVNISKSSSRDSSPKLGKIVDSRSGTPEFFCYETDRSATIVSLKPKSTEDSTTKSSKNLRSKSDSPINVHTNSSRTPGNFSPMKTSKTTANIIKSSNRDSSPKLGKIVDSRSGTPEFFCYETDRSATTVSLKPKSTKDSTVERSKSPRSKSNSPTSIQFRGRSTSPDNFTQGARTGSRSSSPKSQKIVDSRSATPEFFCYETDRSATTVSLKPKSTKDSTTENSKSLRSKSDSPTNVQSRSSKSPANFNSTKSNKITVNVNKSSSRDSSLKSQKIVDHRSGTPKFVYYETEKPTTTMTLKPKSSKDSINERSKSPQSRSSTPSVQSRSRPLKSPDNLAVFKDANITTRRGSGNALRSIKLIRDIIKHQRNKPETDCMSRRESKGSRRTSTVSENAEGMSSVKGTELKHRSGKDESRQFEINRDASKRTTPSPRPYELPTPKSSSKSSTSTEVDAEIQEITMPDQYIKQEKLERDLRSTYSKSCEASQGSKKKSKMESSFTYSVCKAGKKRSSLFESSIFEASGNDQRTTDHRATLESSGNASLMREGDEKDISLKRMVRNASSTKRSCSNSPSPTNESIFRGSKRGIRENIVDGERERKILRSLKQAGGPSQSKDAEKKVSLKETVLGESKNRRSRKQAQTLRSIELVKKMMKSESQGTQQKVFRDAEVPKEITKGYETPSSLEHKIEITRSSSAIIEMTNLLNESGSSSKDYERTDSVESALRRFDSIDTETGTASAQSTLERSKGSIAEKRQTRLESNGIESLTDDSKTISLKALDRGNVNSPRSPAMESMRATLKKTSAVSESELTEASCGTRASKTQETRRQKKLAKARDSIELARTAARSKSPACKRKLFQDAETGSSRSKYSLDSMRTVERLSSRKTESTKSVGDSVRTASKFLKSTPNEMLAKDTGKGETDETSTGEANTDRSVSVKQLRSIKDIRKSIESESPNRRAKGVSLKSAIANDALRGLITVQPQSRRMSSEKCGGNRNEMLSKRSENLSAKNNALGDSEGFVKYASRFSRVAKSPSPDPTKAVETGNRQRRNVPPSPSKSPDTVTRRPSTDSKVQDTKSSRRSMPMKSTEPIGNRKTTTTTRKSTDVVDGAILENGLHLRGQTTETKYDNDSATAKKSEAFVIDFDERPSKENDGPPPRKPLLRKRSTEKQTPSTQSGRPPSSVSSKSSGSSMQASVTKGKMASKAKTPISGTTASKGAASSKGGGSSCTVDGLLVPCKICGRRFAQDRVSLHEQICVKTGQKKRKQFDAMMHRVRGTELETFVRKGIGTCKKLSEKSKKPEVKSNWRRKHEDFINAIRSAKQVQAHLAAGGKLSDLPPPPASDTSDYVQCPHCGRKFNLSAAERHIPKCEHMLHNKPLHSRVPPKPRR